MKSRSGSQPSVALIYTRISDDTEKDQHGVAAQEKLCRRFAEHRGVSVAQVYCDPDLSAYSGKWRPGFEAMLTDAAKQQGSGETVVIIARSQDRLYRRPEDWLRMAKVGALVWTVHGGETDFTNPDDHMMAGFKVLIDQGESAKIAQRVKDSIADRAERGLFTGGRRPYGYEFDKANRTLTVREDEATEIKRLAESVLCGIPLRALARDLRRRGIPNATGRVRWTNKEVRDLLINPRHAGMQVHRGEVIGPASWPPILPVDTHEALVTMLGDPARRTPNRSGPVPTALGTRLYRCATCQAPTMVKSRGRYVCATLTADGTGLSAKWRDAAVRHPTRTAAPLDTYVTGELLDLLCKPGFIAAMRAGTDTPDAPDLAALRVQRQQISNQIEAARGSCNAGRITLPDFEAITARLRAERRDIDETLAAAVKTSALDNLIDYGSPRQAWNALPVDIQRAVLSEVATVTLHPGAHGAKFRADAVEITLTPQAQAASGQPPQPFSPPPVPIVRPLTDPEIEQARARWLTGQTRESIAAELGAAPHTVAAVLVGVKRRDPRKALTPEQEQQARDRYAAGEPVAAIAADLEVSHNAVYRATSGVALADGRPNRTAALTPAQIADIQARHAAGETIQALCDAYRVSWNAIRPVLPAGDFRKDRSGRKAATAADLRTKAVSA